MKKSYRRYRMRLRRDLRAAGIDGWVCGAITLLFVLAIATEVTETLGGREPTAVAVSGLLSVLQACAISVLLVVMSRLMHSVGARRRSTFWAIEVKVDAASAEIESLRAQCEERTQNVRLMTVDYISKYLLQAMKQIKDERRKDGEGWKGP